MDSELPITINLNFIMSWGSSFDGRKIIHYLCNAIIYPFIQLFTCCFICFPLGIFCFIQKLRILLEPIL